MCVCVCVCGNFFSRTITESYERPTNSEVFPCMFNFTTELMVYLHARTYVSCRRDFKRYILRPSLVTWKLRVSFSTTERLSTPHQWSVRGPCYSLIFTARRYAKRGICRRRVSVCLCVCLSHSGIVSQVALLWQMDRATRLSVEILQLQNIPFEN